MNCSLGYVAKKKGIRLHRIPLGVFCKQRWPGYASAGCSAASSLRTSTVAGDPAGFVRFPDRPSLAIAHEVFHSADPSGRTPLIGLQGMVAAKVEPLERMADALHMLPPLPPDASGYDYLAISKPSLISDLPPRGFFRLGKGAD